LHFKPNDEFKEWKGDVEEDPSWDEHQNHAHESSEPVENKPNWSKNELEDEVWNQHD
jgi:hypothetical protein